MNLEETEVVNVCVIYTISLSVLTLFTNHVQFNFDRKTAG